MTALRSVCVLIFLLFAGTHPVFGQKGIPADLPAKAEAYLRPYLEVRGFSGAILVARNGKVLLSKGYGMANYELDVPNTPKTKFQIASVSKPFTAAAILLLEERGLLSVNDLLSKFIPDYPEGGRITLHHLLGHTSGIPNVNNFPDYDDKSRFPQTLPQVIEMFKGKPLEFQPGERYRYSNSNYNLLAYVLEKVSGKSYGAFLKENIFDPLGMNDTGHWRAGALIRNHASGYVPVGVSELENAPYLDWSIKTGNGSLYSTVEDLYKFDRALYTEKLLKKATLARMFEKGYAWFTGKRHNRPALWYGGRSPGFTSALQRYVEDDTCIVVLGNNYAPTASLIADDLAAMVFGDKYTIPDVRRPVPLPPATLDTYTGRYEGGKDFFLPGVILTVEKQQGQLILRWSTGAVAPLTPQSETRFFDRTFWATVTFHKDAAGKVTHLVWRYDRDYVAKRVD